MFCYRCSHCCYWFMVTIVKEEYFDKIKTENDLTMDAVEIKEERVWCKYLINNLGKFVCTIHHYSWFKFTPCYQFTQMEENKDSPCRIGEWYRGEGIKYYDDFLLNKWREHNETKING